MTAALGGFANPVLSSQTTFRRIMDATARPGTVLELADLVEAPKALSRAAAAIALTLCDADTPLWLDRDLASVAALADWLRFHTGAPIVAEPGRAAFAFLSAPDSAPPFGNFALGTPEYPDRSATLILQVDSLERGRALQLTGPGIRGRSVLQVSPIPADFCERNAANRALFPRGVDLLLVTDRAIAALPRSTVVSEES